MQLKNGDLIGFSYSFSCIETFIDCHRIIDLPIDKTFYNAKETTATLLSNSIIPSQQTRVYFEYYVLYWWPFNDFLFVKKLE